MRKVRVSVTHHTARYNDTRVAEVAVVTRQTLRGCGRWRTTRAVIVDAGAATLHRARQIAAEIAPAIYERRVDHGDLGSFDCDTAAGALALYRAVRALADAPKDVLTAVADSAAGRVPLAT